MGKKIVVAGGAGFIGSHLCDFLIDKGEEVVCIDSLITGDEKNIAHLTGKNFFSFIENDVSQSISLAFPVKQIYNLASPASPVDYQEKPLETLAAGSLGVRNMLELAREKNASCLFASTSEVYGNPLQHPQKETYWGNVNPVGPRSCYDEAKRFGEATCVAYKKVFGIDVKIARIFNTYGPRMRKEDGRVVPNFIDQALHNRSITIYGKGEQTRSFCYVSDMVDGLYKLMNSKEMGPINIGNPKEKTIFELAELIIKLTDSKSKIVYKPLPLDDPERRLPDIMLAKEKLGWQPKVGLEEGLNKTVEFFS
ncbi:MAG TPA: UDP-glucuronic acid decarboxylase family protein [archaeon]|nr:UDP-glucuronic acid decarboxylase family protein [archaeon]